MDFRPTHLLATCVAVVLLAAGLRFYQLGDRPFHDDELGTLREADAVFQPVSPDLTMQDRLSRAIPISYLLHWVDYQCFGRTEWGSRFLPAVLGVVSVLAVIAGLLLAREGAATAFITAVLLALWPQHVYYSQQNRFYITAFVCASLCMLAGSIALHKRSQRWMAIAAGLGLLAAFSHTVLLLLLPGLVGAVLLAALATHDGRLLRLAVSPLIALVVACCLYVFYFRPLLHGWNGDPGWGLSPFRSIGAAVFKLGWPLFLLAGMGTTVALSRRREQDWYWLSWGGVWLVACLGLPLVIQHHSAYTFPLTLGMLVLAARGAAYLAERLADASRLAAVAWVALACLLNFPALVSHYMDGSCPDYRTVAEYIRRHWRTGDRTVATSWELLRHYLANGNEVEPLDLYNPQGALQGLVHASQAPGRLWIAVNYGRANRPTAVLEWLGKNCTRELELAAPRYDGLEYPTLLFLSHAGPATGPYLENTSKTPDMH